MAVIVLLVVWNYSEKGRFPCLAFVMGEFCGGSWALLYDGRFHPLGGFRVTGTSA